MRVAGLLMVLLLSGCAGTVYDSGQLTLDLSGSLPWTGSAAQAATLTEGTTADFDMTCTVNPDPGEGEGNYLLEAVVPAGNLGGVTELRLAFDIFGYYLADDDTYAFDFVPGDGGGTLGLDVVGETNTYEHTPDAAASWARTAGWAPRSAPACG